MKISKNHALFIGAIFLIILLTTSVTYMLIPEKTVYMQETGSIPLSFTVGSIHSTITIFKDEVKIFEEYHSGAITKLGLNFTLGKLNGNSWYNMSQYLLNTTYIGIGNQGTLNSDSVVLPGEWNRTVGTIEDQAYNSFNITCTFYPDAGPYTADCIGLYFHSANNCLWGYDIFGEVTNIDDTFTIIVEIKVSAS